MDLHEKNVYLRDHGVTVTFQGDSRNPEWGFELASLRDVLRSVNPAIDVEQYWQEQERQAHRARVLIGA